MSLRIFALGRKFVAMALLNVLLSVRSEGGRELIHSLWLRRMKENMWSVKSWVIVLSKNKKNKTSSLRMSRKWLPEMEVRDLQILEEYIRSHRDFAKSR
jgi:hypothetical protein